MAHTRVWPPVYGTHRVQEVDPPSAALFGDVEGGTHHGPNLLDVDPGLQGAVHRAAAEFGEHMVMGQRGGPDRAELLVHPLPKMGYPHPSRLGAGPEISC